MKAITIKDIDINGGFWQYRQELNHTSTIPAVYERFKETGRFDALKCDLSEGIKPHVFWDSDVAKWMEGASYILAKQSDEKLMSIIEDAIDNIEKNADDCGYFNSYYLTVKKNGRWSERCAHELYCAGHLIEAAIAYYEATGRDRFLKLMCKFADYIYETFAVKNRAAFRTPGHEEIELALIKLYKCTKNERYLELSKYFIDTRGVGVEMDTVGCERYDQSHLPVREQKTAEGHCVRALYLYIAMADMARVTGDDELFDSCRSIFEDIIRHKIYITGGVGSTRAGESFTVDYDLPNERAYTESCASIALCMFAKRMLMLDVDSKYADTCETVLYNGFLSATSLDGKAFFYENPLEIHPKLRDREIAVRPENREKLPIMQRVEVFNCSCCPPNIVRFIPCFGEYMYNYDDTTIYIHHYAQSIAKVGISEVEQITDYPNDGKITVRIQNAKRLALRIPGWCENYSFKINNETVSPEIIKGYAYFNIEGDAIIETDFEIKTQLIEAKPDVIDCAGKVAIRRGAFVYCAEEVDNGKNISAFRIDLNTDFKPTYNEQFKTYVLECDAYVPDFDEDNLYKAVRPLKETKLKLIPYYAFANRGECEMAVWFGRKN